MNNWVTWKCFSELSLGNKHKTKAIHAVRDVLAEKRRVRVVNVWAGESFGKTPNNSEVFWFIVPIIRKRIRKKNFSQLKNKMFENTFNQLNCGFACTNMTMKKIQFENTWIYFISSFLSFSIFFEWFQAWIASYSFNCYNIFASYQFPKSVTRKIFCKLALSIELFSQMAKLLQPLHFHQSIFNDASHIQWSII